MLFFILVQNYLQTCERIGPDFKELVDQLDAKRICTFGQLVGELGFGLQQIYNFSSNFFFGVLDFIRLGVPDLNKAALDDPLLHLDVVIIIDRVDCLD